MIKDNEGSAKDEDPLMQEKAKVLNVLKPLIKDVKVLALLMGKLGKGDPIGGISKRLICGLNNYDDDHPWEIYRKFRVAKN